MYLDCGVPYYLKYGALSYSLITVGGIAFFDCYRDYIQIGGITSVCLSNGTWSTPPFCVGEEVKSEDELYKLSNL